ncbi:MAG: TRAP transporter large permease subunit [Gammaproteobacteria bacterium]
MSAAPPLLLFVVAIALLMAGYPVAFTLAGVALIMAGIGIVFGTFDPSLLGAIPSRLFGGTMTNELLVAVPIFVFMGVVLERAKIAEALLDTLGLVLGRLRGGMAISVMVVGMLLAASTGIVGATVVTMGLLSLPTMIKRGYDPALASGSICAAGTLGQIIPPSIALVLLGDVLSSAYQEAQRRQGIFSVDTVSVGDLFMGAAIPGLLLVVIYILYLLVVSVVRPASMPPVVASTLSTGALAKRVVQVLIPPLALIVAVLGSIITGIASPTEAASVGAMGALLLAGVTGALNIEMLRDVARTTTRVSSMVFLILIGASIFSLVFRGFGGDEVVRELLSDLPGGATGALVVVMLMIFLLGFVLDFIEITFVVVPIVGPVLLALGIDPVWLGVMIAINLQTSFLTPPFGFALFYLRGVAPESVPTSAIYRGVMPFVALQVLMLGILALWPELATWLPDYLNSR